MIHRSLTLLEHRLETTDFDWLEYLNHSAFLNGDIAKADELEVRDYLQFRDESDR
jgi:regulator of RNase E activity RraB